MSIEELRAWCLALMVPAFLLGLARYYHRKEQENRKGPKKMNCNDGSIVPIKELPKEKQDALARAAYDLDKSLTRSEQMKAMKPYVALKNEDVPKLRHMSKPRRKTWMRNQLCPCGSGNKFKKCCWNSFVD